MGSVTGLVFSSTYPGALTICAPPARLPYDLEIKEEWCSVYLHHGRTHDLPNHQRLSQQYGPQMTVKHVRSKLDLQSRCISMAQRRMFSIPTYRTGKRPSLRIIHVLFMGVKV